jgi:hypothetical protein
MERMRIGRLTALERVATWCGLGSGAVPTTDPRGGPLGPAGWVRLSYRSPLTWRHAVVVETGVDPVTFRFSGGRSAN